MRSFIASAEGAQFQVIWATGNPSENLVEILLQEFSRIAQHYEGKLSKGFHAALERLAMTLNLGFAELGLGPAKSNILSINQERALQDSLVETVETLTSNGLSGLVIFVDEMQEVDKSSLKTFAITWQDMQEECGNLPLIFAGAGLRNTPDILTDAASFAERVRYIKVGNLSDQDAEIALRAPAHKIKVRWSDNALKIVINEVDGYPTFIQEFGDLIWKSALSTDEGSVFTSKDVEAAYEKYIEPCFQNSSAHVG